MAEPPRQDPTRKRLFKGKHSVPQKPRLSFSVQQPIWSSWQQKRQAHPVAGIGGGGGGGEGGTAGRGGKGGTSEGKGVSGGGFRGEGGECVGERRVAGIGGGVRGREGASVGMGSVGERAWRSVSEIGTFGGLRGLDVTTLGSDTRGGFGSDNRGDLGSDGRGGFGSGTVFHPTAWRCGIPAVVRRRRIKTIADWSDDDGNDNGGDGDGDGDGGCADDGDGDGDAAGDGDWLDEDGEEEGVEAEEGEEEAVENEEEKEEEAGEEGGEVEGREKEAEEEEQDERELEGLRERHVRECGGRRKRRRVIGNEEEEEQEAGKWMGEERRGNIGVQESVEREEGAGREEQDRTMGGNDDDRDADNDDRDADNDDRDADNDGRDADNDGRDADNDGRDADNDGRDADNDGRDADNDGRDADNDGRDADNDGRDADHDGRDADSDDSMMTQPDDEATWQSLIEQSTVEIVMESAREGGRRKVDGLEILSDSQEEDKGGGGRIRVEEEQEREGSEGRGKGKKGGEVRRREEVGHEEGEGREKAGGSSEMVQSGFAGSREGRSEGRGVGRGEEGRGEVGKGGEGRGEEERGECANGGREEENLSGAEEKVLADEDARCVQDEAEALEEGEGMAMGEFDFEPPSFSLHVQPSELHMEPDARMNFLPSQGVDAPSLSFHPEAPPKSPPLVQPSEIQAELDGMNFSPSQGLDAPSFSLNPEAPPKMGVKHETAFEAPEESGTQESGFQASQGLDAPSFSLGLEGWDGEEGALGDGQCMTERDGQQGAAERVFDRSHRKMESTVGDDEGLAKREAWEGKQGAVEQRVAVGWDGERCREDERSERALGDGVYGRVESGKKVKVEVSGAHADVAGSAGGAAASAERDGGRRFKRLRKAVEPPATQTPATTPTLSEATRQLLQRRLPHLQLVGWLEERGCDANGDPVFIDYRCQFGSETPSGADTDRGGRPFSQAHGNENENENGCYEVGGSGFPCPQQPAGVGAAGSAARKVHFEAPQNAPHYMCPQQPAGAGGAGSAARNGGRMGGEGFGRQQQLSQQQGGSGRRRGSGGGGGAVASRAGGGGGGSSGGGVTGRGVAGSSGGHWVAEGGKKVSCLTLCFRCVLRIREKYLLEGVVMAAAVVDIGIGRGAAASSSGGHWVAEGGKKVSYLHCLCSQYCITSAGGSSGGGYRKGCCR
ncbi:unnamed protein product [Closterium sp. NIES-65]|nr:unnamed protein product [Closterium sp. NIES-65]